MFKQALANAIFLAAESPQEIRVGIAAVESPLLPGQVVPLIAHITDAGVYIRDSDDRRAQWTHKGEVADPGDGMVKQLRLLAFRDAKEEMPWTVIDSRCSRVLPALDTLAEIDPEALGSVALEM